MNSTITLTVMTCVAAMAFVACGDDAKSDDPVVIIGNNANNVSNNGTTNTSNNANTNQGSNNQVACVVDDDCAPNQVCVADTCMDAAMGPQTLIGTGVQTAAAATLTEIFKPNTAIEAPDLEFHPTRNELWVLNRRFEVGGVCGESSGFNARCASLGGLTTILFNPGQVDQRAQFLEDENSWHFMRRPPAMAMGAAETFATCAEAATGNFEDDPTMFVGPSLWSSDLAIYAQPSGLNGSHLDMLHATPWCMGIAHERANIYWLFNGNVGSLDRYDFKADHGPGAADHSDGEIHRYAEGTVKRVPNVPSHMIFDGNSTLYVADTGNARIIKLDTTSGTPGRAFSPVYEPLADYGFMDDAVVAPVVENSALTLPSGLALHNNVLYVSDHASSIFYAFDLQGNLLASLETGLPTGSLAGIEVGPDNKIWFTNMATGAVYRLDLN